MDPTEPTADLVAQEHQEMYVLFDFNIYNFARTEAEEAEAVSHERSF